MKILCKFILWVFYDSLRIVLKENNGITDDAYARWILLARVWSRLRLFCVLSVNSKLCDERYSSDVEILKQYRDIHPPFPLIDRLLLISSGIVGTTEINFHNGSRKGNRSVKQITGNEFGNLSFKRKDEVRTLALMSTFDKVRDIHVCVTSPTIFHRFCIINQSVRVGSIPHGIFERRGYAERN